MKDKTQILLEKVYQRILEGDMGPVREESPEGEAIRDAMTDLDLRETAKNDVIGKYVTIYKRERSQSFANKSDLPGPEIKAGERLHSTSEVVGSIPVASGIVKDVLWQNMRTNEPVRLVLDTDDDESEERTKEITVPFDIRDFLVVRKPFPKLGTQDKIGRDRYSGKW